MDNAPPGWEMVPERVWKLAAELMGSRRKVWWALARCGNRAAVGALRRAAFAGGARSWESRYAHRVLVLGLLLLELARPTRRKGRWRYCYEGVPRKVLCLLLRDPHSGHTPCIESLSGTHRADDPLQVGYLRALEGAGFLYRLQRQRPSRHFPNIRPTTNQYWLVGHSAYVTGEQLLELLQLICEAEDIQRPLARAQSP